MILLVSGVFAIAVGYARGGRLGGLSEVPLWGAAPMLALFAGQLFLRRAASDFHLLGATSIVWLWCAVTLGLLVLCSVNRRIPGMTIIGLGIGLNLTVVLLNAGMPVGGPLAAAMDMSPSAVSIERYGGFYQALDSETAASALGDVIPVVAPAPLRALVSLGDLVMFLGAGILIEEGMYGGRYRPRHSAKPEGAPTQPSP